jgi:hypothetical protein
MCIYIYTDSENLYIKVTEKKTKEKGGFIS